MVSRAINTAYSTGGGANGLWRAIVQAVNDNSINVTIPRLGQNNVYENVPYIGFTPQVGDRIWVGFIEGRSFEPVAFIGATDTSTDITEIVAGTNLNGGGTGGSITVNLDDDITLSTVTADSFYGDLYGAIHIPVKNVSGGSLTKGTPVYATGAVGASGAVEVEASLAGTGSTMPAMGLLDQDLANNGEGDVVVSGVLQNIDTDTPGYSVGDELYVAASGGLTTTRPTGSSELVQKIGKVVRVQQNTGEILVQGAGRTNDVPNSFSITGDMTVGGDVTVTGDLTVNGTTVTLNTETLTVEDNIIVLNSNVSGAPSLDAGIEVERGSSSNVSFLWDESADAWSIGAVDFVVDTDTLFVDASEDRVGIGTSSPGYTLDVNGTINVSGDVYYNNNAIVASNAGTSNIDHIWHDESANAWNFVSDSTYKAAGNSAIVAGSFSGNGANLTSVDASTLGGLSLKSSSGTPSGSQVLRSHTNGYTYLGWINTPSGATTSTIDRIYASNDNFVRYVTPATFRSQVTDPHYLPLSGGTMTGELQLNARLDVGDGTNSNHEIRIYKADNNVSDHIQFYNGTTRVGEIGVEDTSWLRINQETAKNIYTPRLLRADGGFQAGNGSAATPAYSFQGDSNTGFYITGNSGVIYWSGNNNTGGYLWNTGIRTDNGSQSTPAYSFTGDTDTGMFRSSANELALAAGGNASVFITSTALSTDLGVGIFSWPGTGTGNDAEWVATGFGNYYLVRNSSLRAEKENIQDPGTELTASLIDQVEPKLWNRIHAPGVPEIGPIAEDMDAISPYLAAHGFDEDGNTFLTGFNKTGWMSLMTLAIKDLRSQVADLTTRLGALEAE